MAVDIKPGSCPNPLNVKSKGVLPVAIVGGSLDLTRIDPSSIKLEGVRPLRVQVADVASPFKPSTGKTDCSSHCTTRGGDNIPDILLMFDKQAIVRGLGKVRDRECKVMKLTGNLKKEFGGTPIVGEDVVVILNKGSQKGHKNQRRKGHNVGGTQG